jgi:hypothetical protein
VYIFLYISLEPLIFRNCSWLGLNMKCIKNLPLKFPSTNPSKFLQSMPKIILTFTKILLQILDCLQVNELTIFVCIHLNILTVSINI